MVSKCGWHTVCLREFCAWIVSRVLSVENIPEAVDEEGRVPGAAHGEPPHPEGRGRENRDAKAKQRAEGAIGWEPASEGPEKLSIWY